MMRGLARGVAWSCLAACAAVSTAHADASLERQARAQGLVEWRCAGRAGWQYHVSRDDRSGAIHEDARADATFEYIQYGAPPGYPAAISDAVLLHATTQGSLETSGSSSTPATLGEPGSASRYSGGGTPAASQTHPCRFSFLDDTHWSFGAGVDFDRNCSKSSNDRGRTTNTRDPAACPPGNGIEIGLNASNDTRSRIERTKTGFRLHYEYEVGHFAYRGDLTLEPFVEPRYQAFFHAFDDWDAWLPEGAKPWALSTGNSFHVGVLIVDRRTGKPVSVAHSVRYTLTTSYLPGICMNFPPQAADDPHEPDLYFDLPLQPAPPARDGLSMFVAHDSGAPVIVSSRDYAGYGKLEAHVRLADGTELDAVVPRGPTTAGGQPELRLPRDDNGNHIADAWEKSAGIFARNLAGESDDETDENFGTRGDGLTLFAEYRGFMMGFAANAHEPRRSKWNERHERFDPLRRDLVVAANLGDFESGVANEALTLFTQATGIVTHSIGRRAELGDEAGDLANHPRQLEFRTDGSAELGRRPMVALWLTSAVPPAEGDVATAIPVTDVIPSMLDDAEYGSPDHIRAIALSFAAAANRAQEFARWADPDWDADGNPAIAGAHQNYLRAQAKILSAAQARALVADAQDPATAASIAQHVGALAVLRELGRAAGAGTHNEIETLGAGNGDPDCPMRPWSLFPGSSDSVVTRTRLLRGDWDGSVAPDGHAWRFSSTNRRQMSIAHQDP